MDFLWISTYCYEKKQVVPNVDFDIRNIEFETRCIAAGKEDIVGKYRKEFNLETGRL
ncbi:MAG: hypothetical protein K2K54_12435 [Lachnospiraceae bacterium]|nr:hypothetical protein [Lachnospiraceae bacterium]